MAFRATRHWRSVMANAAAAGGGGAMPQVGGKSNNLRNRTLANAAATTHPHAHHNPPKSRNALKADHAPIYIVFGMIMVAVSIGAHTAKQQLAYSPAVKVSKKKRESVPEVDQPQAMVGSSDKFINKSFLRKVGHIQDPASRTLPDPTRPDPFTCSRDVETLQSVGVSRGGGSH